MAEKNKFSDVWNKAKPVKQAPKEDKQVTPPDGKEQKNG